MGVHAQVRVFFVIGWLDSEIGLETFHSLINIQRTDVCGFFLFCFHFSCLCWVFVAARGLSLVASSGGCSVAVHALLIVVASLVAAHRLSCSMACEIFLEQALNPYPLYWQADTYPLYHQGNPVWEFWFYIFQNITGNWLLDSPYWQALAS